MRTTSVPYACGMLQFEPDSSLADWVAQRDEPWEQLVTMGPTGFESYARVRYLDEDRISQGVLHGRLRVYWLVRRPRGLFPRTLGRIRQQHVRRRVARHVPMVPSGVLSGPKLRVPQNLAIPARQYMLFRGSLEEIGHWGARELTTGSSKGDELPAPHLCGPGTTGGSSPRTWTRTSPGWAGPKD